MDVPSSTTPASEWEIAGRKNDDREIEKGNWCDNLHCTVCTGAVMAKLVRENGLGKMAREKTVREEEPGKKAVWEKWSGYTVLKNRI